MKPITLLVAALTLDSTMTVDTLGQPGPAQLFALARILLHGQVALGLVGSLTFVYGTIHPGELRSNVPVQLRTG